MKNRLFHSRLFLNLAVVSTLVFGVLGLAIQPAAAAPVAASAPATPAAEGARMLIVGVAKGDRVTIQALGFAPSLELQVLMGQIGTRGENGIASGKATTDSKGEFTRTFTIPADLRTRNRIAIRVEATNGANWYAYNWFYNANSGSVGQPSGDQPATGEQPSAGGSSGGVISVLDVEEDQNVTISAQRLPANTTFSAWLQWKNRRGVVSSFRVASLTSDRSGALTATLALPLQLRDRALLAVRLEAVGGSRFVSQAWFLNMDSENGVGAGSPNGFDTGIPLLKIEAVQPSQSVTLSATRLPPRTEFAVLMGRMGSEGIGGVRVEFVKSDKDGAFSATFDIPAELRNRDRIAIRLESTGSASYYAFTWFENR